MVAAKQRGNTKKHQKAAQPSQRTPLVGRSDLFVTESNPSTPDPAEFFRAFQQEIEGKRRDGTLTWQDEIHKIKWHRVVLDEAQAIKNHKSLTSLSCCALPDKNFWAISGTPLLNGVEIFYSLSKSIMVRSLALFTSFCHTDH